jgi:hypothetical protein
MFTWLLPYVNISLIIARYDKFMKINKTGRRMPSSKALLLYGNQENKK